MVTTLIKRNPASLSTEELVAEWRQALRHRGDLLARREQVANGLAQRTGAHAARAARERDLWGPNHPGIALPAPPSERGAREELATAERLLADAAAWRGEVGAELRRRLVAEEAAQVAEREELASEERALVERLGRLRALTAPLLDFEGYPSIDGQLPLQGLTWRLEASVRSRREQIGQRERRLTSLRRVAAETTAVE